MLHRQQLATPNAESQRNRVAASDGEGRLNYRACEAPPHLYAAGAVVLPKAWTAAAIDPLFMPLKADEPAVNFPQKE